MNGRIIVIGSVNVDLVNLLSRLPGPGETVSGGTFGQHHGGKGANQAVAARRLGVTVEFVGATGADPFGDAAAAALVAEGVGVSELRRVPAAPTGVALILVAESGENMIAVAPGANRALSPEDVQSALARLAVTPGDVVIVSHEIPTASARAALMAARDAGARSIFNPAPATGLDRGTFGLADVLTPNRSELALLAGDEARRTGRSGVAGATPEQQARMLMDASAEGEGPRIGIVVTLGAAGALLVAREGAGTWSRMVPARRVVAVDSTGAGDAFNGALAAGLVQGRTLEACVRRSVAAAGLAVTKAGAREGMPTLAELDAALAD